MTEHKFIIRPAKLNDVPKLTQIGRYLVKTKMHLRPDLSDIKDLIIRSISSKAHLPLVAFCDGDIVGVLLINSDGFMFAEKQYAQIMCFYTTMQGAAIALLNSAMAWVETRPAILMVCYSMPVTSGVDDFLLDNDFERSGSMIIWRRYGTF